MNTHSTDERRPSRAFIAVRSLGYAIAFVMLWTWIIAAAAPFDERLGFYLPAWLRLPGLVLAGLGAVLTVACVVAFTVAGLGTPAPFDAPRHFVATGPYRYLRNPMFLGAAIVLVGAAFMLRSPTTLGVAVLFLLLAHAFIVLYEEPTLERKFGDEYRAYRSAVRRWMPGRPAA